MGVKRAVEKAIEMRELHPDARVYTLGELIHNPTTLKKLESLNIKVLCEAEIETKVLEKSDIIIIRAHGVSPLVLSKLKEKGVVIVDCTCPRVVANRKLAQKCAKNGVVILVGDKNHPELVSIYGYVLENPSVNCIIIQSEKEAEELRVENKTLPHYLIAQTTIKEEEFLAIKNVLEKKIENFRALNTICPATFERQNALKELVKNVDAVLVIGGKNSANTKRLFLTAKEIKPNSFLAEGILDLPKEIEQFKSIGLASGASTPEEIIEEIENYIK